MKYNPNQAIEGHLLHQLIKLGTNYEIPDIFKVTPEKLEYHLEKVTGQKFIEVTSLKYQVIELLVKNRKWDNVLLRGE